VSELVVKTVDAPETERLKKRKWGGWSRRGVPTWRSGALAV